jgi:hypothetical protein
MEPLDIEPDDEPVVAEGGVVVVSLVLCAKAAGASAMQTAAASVEGLKKTVIPISLGVQNNDRLAADPEP